MAELALVRTYRTLEDAHVGASEPWKVDALLRQAKGAVWPESTHIPPLSRRILRPSHPMYFYALCFNIPPGLSSARLRNVSALNLVRASRPS